MPDIYFKIYQDDYHKMLYSHRLILDKTFDTSIEGDRHDLRIGFHGVENRLSIQNPFLTDD
jgi:hypothetical protein